MTDEIDWEATAYEAVAHLTRETVASVIENVFSRDDARWIGTELLREGALDAFLRSA